MEEMKRLGEQLRAAGALEIPPELVAAIVTTQHAGRLKELFRKASLDLLDAHENARRHPHSPFALHERTRRKCLVDLIRARTAAIGCRKPSVDRILATMRPRSNGKIVDIKKAA